MLIHLLDASTLNFGIGTIIPVRVFARQMAKEGRGSILNFASMNSARPLTRAPAYAMSKAAVVNLTQWLATYFAPAGIRVNAIAPGLFVNDRSRKIFYTPDGSLSQRGENVMRHTPMLENLGNDIQCSVYSIAELQYENSGPITKTNTKGLLMTDVQNRVLRPQIAYYAVQHITAIFDDSLDRIRETGFRHMIDNADTDAYWCGTDRSLAVYGYRYKATSQSLYTIWKSDTIPGDDRSPQPLNFTLVGSQFLKIRYWWTSSQAISMRFLLRIGGAKEILDLFGNLVNGKEM